METCSDYGYRSDPLHWQKDCHFCIESYGGLSSEKKFTNCHRVLNNRANWSSLQGSKILLGLIVVLLLYECLWDCFVANAPRNDNSVLSFWLCSPARRSHSSMVSGLTLNTRAVARIPTFSRKQWRAR